MTSRLFTRRRLRSACMCVSASVQVSLLESASICKPGWLTHLNTDKCAILVFSWSCHQRLIPPVVESFETVKQTPALFLVADQSGKLIIRDLYYARIQKQAISKPRVYILRVFTTHNHFESVFWFYLQVNKVFPGATEGLSLHLRAPVTVQLSGRFPSLASTLEVMFNSITDGGCERRICSTADCLTAADLRAAYRGKERILCGREKRFFETSAVIKSGLSL